MINWKCNEPRHPIYMWKPHKEYFYVADGKIFTTNLISEGKFEIKVLPKCIILYKV